MADAKAVRVLVIVSRKSPHWACAWDSTENIVLPIALRIIRDQRLIHSSESSSEPTTLRLLVKQKWPLRILFVFDVSNETYKPELGHLPEQNNLPVVVVHLGVTSSAYRDSVMTQNRVNNGVGHAHNVNGTHGVPPFMEDHTGETPPCYLNPRDPSLLQ